jgi:hypothetical protein
MEKPQRNDRSTAQRMTGMESLRVLKICLGKWAKLTGVEYMQWLADEADWDPGISADWENSIDEMVKEREDEQFELHAYKAPGSVYKHCECQDRDSWDPSLPFPWENKEK